MSIEHYLSTRSPTVCDVLRAAAMDTWERIGFSRSTKGMKCHETALTQNLVYEMKILKDKHRHLEYDLFESINEKANGHDLLFRILHADGKVYTYAIQAKVIYHTITTKSKLRLENGWYVQLKHMVSKGKLSAEPQVDKLLRFARTNGYIPMYLLYNYVSKDYGATIDESYGCTVVGAKFMKDGYTDSIDDDLRNDVKFTELHTEHAFPWEELVCSLPSYSKYDFLGKVGLDRNYQLNGLDRYELKPSKMWSQLTQKSDNLEFINPRNAQDRKVQNEFKEEYDEGFNPKYLCTIGKPREEQ